MNTYLIPISESYGYNFEYFMPVFAQTQEEAYKWANDTYDDRIADKPPYEFYEFKLKINKNLYKMSNKDDVLSSSLKKTKGFEYMTYFKVNWNNYTDQLSKKATQETWSNATYPNKGILANYIVKTYNKLQSEKKCCF